MLHPYISLINKTNKDLLDCSNYRPIVLLNSDLKIFTKILANRLFVWLTHLVQKYQVGFIPVDKEGIKADKQLTSLML